MRNNGKITLNNHQMKALREARQSISGNHACSNKNLARLLSQMGFEVRGGKKGGTKDVYYGSKKLVGSGGPVRIPLKREEDYFLSRYVLQTATNFLDRGTDYQV